MARPIKTPQSQSSPVAMPDHARELVRLKRIRGQIEGVEKMIQERRYCVDILNQAKAARAALQAFEKAVLTTHLRGCVRAAFKGQDPAIAEQKIIEITELLGR